jgi:hypothetical protein
LLGKYEGRLGAALRNLEMVAEVRNLLIAPTIGFEIPIVESAA